MTLRKEQKSSGPARARSDSGLYILLLRLDSPVSTRVGAIGTVRFKPGYYAYCGSARRNLSRRLRRHMTRRKRVRWHIDYLTSRRDVEVVSARIFPQGRLTECELNFRVRGGRLAEPVPGFGCSDCRCNSHLTFLGHEASGLPEAPGSSHAR